MSEQEVSRLWQMYRAGQDYLTGLDLPRTVKENVAFYEGRQWGRVTPATKNMPRPVVNIVKMVCRNKRARLALSPVKLVYKCQSNPALGDRFTRFADYMAKEMRLKELDSRAIKDGVVKGSYCYHFYWDPDCHDTLGEDKGALRCELIDPLNVLFANPREMDEQKQDWVMIVSRMPLGKVKQLADRGVDESILLADDDQTDRGEDRLCTVLTRYFRVEGEVYCERALKLGMLNAPFALSPSTYGTEGGEVVQISKTHAGLYPIVFGSYEEREGSVYGLSEVEGIIPNQKVLNHILGMEAMAIQNTAWGKFVVTKDALKGQQISNEPGEVLVDHSASGNGIRRLPYGAMTGIPLSYVDSLSAMTRSVTGSSEIMTGEQLRNMSGAAIIALQAQANQPIEEARERFWRSKERQGKVLAQCCLLYYDSKEWYDEDGTPSRQIFVADDYEGVPMAVTVQACQGTGSSTAADVSLLETLFARGAIDALTFVNAYPEEALNDKEGILRCVQGYAEAATRATIADPSA